VVCDGAGADPALDLLAGSVAEVGEAFDEFHLERCGDWARRSL
jgi:hypothetical protein